MSYTDEEVIRIREIYDSAIRKILMKTMPVTIYIEGKRLYGLSPSITQKLAVMTNEDVAITIFDVYAEGYHCSAGIVNEHDKAILDDVVKDFELAELIDAAYQVEQNKASFTILSRDGIHEQTG